MWLFWCLISTIVNGFTAIALKKCSNNEPKRIALMGLLSFHLITIIVSILINPALITKLNISDVIKISPGIIMQSIGFYCMISATKYGKVSITSTISKTRVVIPFLLGILILKENCTLLQLFVSITLVILSIIIARKTTDTKNKIDKKLERKSIIYAYGFVFFNGISGFLNKIYITQYQDPVYVVFNASAIVIIGLFIYLLLTKNWNYIDIRKINAKKFFILQSIFDASASLFNRFALLEGNVSVVYVINTSSIVITILASRFILKEQIGLKKYLLIIGIFICVLILSLIK